MTRIAPVLLGSAVLALTACSPKANNPADIQAVKQTVEAYGKALNAGDTEGAVAMLTDKTIYADNHVPAVTGKAAVRSMIAAQNNLFKTEFSALCDEVRVAGDAAVARGTWTVKLAPRIAGMAPINDGGTFMLLAGRQADGSWKWDWVVPNSNQPMPGTTADGADEQAVMQVEQDVATASVKRDLAVIERSLAKDYTSVTDGKADDVTKMMAEFKAGAYRIESFTLSDLKVHVLRDAAIATMTQSVKGTYKGTAFSNDYRITDFFIKRDGRWQIVNEQSITTRK
jgi:ketosteroid isomerase-like protein